jgi:hypothetical protein
MWQLENWVTKFCINNRDFLILLFGDLADNVIRYMSESIMIYWLEKEFVTVKPFCYITSPVLFKACLEKAKDSMDIDELRTLTKVSDIAVALLNDSNLKGYDTVLNAILEAKQVYKMSVWESYFTKVD